MIRLGYDKTSRALNEFASVLSSEDREMWLQDCNDNSRFILGGNGQWTQEELDSLEERGGYSITMDMTRKAITSQVGLITAERPKYKIDDDGADRYISKIRNMQLDKTWKKSKGLMTITDIAYNAYSSNIGYAYVYPKDGVITFKGLGYEEVIVDQESKDSMFEDARWIAVQKFVSVDAIKLQFNIPELSPTMSSPHGSTLEQSFNTAPMFDKFGQNVRVIEVFRKFRDKDQVRIKRQLIVGYYHMFEEIMSPNIKTYPVIPLYSNISRNPYKLSELHFMKDPQRFINKMYNVTIMNAQATGSPKVFVRSIDIPSEDADSFSTNYSIPGSVNILNPGAEPPVQVNAQPLTSSFFNLYQDATNYMMRQYSSLGVDGSEKDSQSTGSILERREAIMDSMRVMTRIFDEFLTKLGMSVLEHWSTYVSKDVVTRVCKGHTVIDSIEEDMAKGLDVRDPKSIDGYVAKAKESGATDQQIQESLETAKDKIEYMESLADVVQGIEDLEYDLSVVKGSYSPNYTATNFNMIMDLANVGAVDSETILKYSPLEDKEEIIKRMNTVKQLSGQLEMASKELEKMKQELKTKDTQIERLMLQMIKTKEEARFDKQYKEGQLNNQYAKKTNRLSLDKQQFNQQIEFERFMLELEKNDSTLDDRREVSMISVEDV